MLADAGFTLNPLGLEPIIGYVPNKRSAHESSLSDEEKRYNKKLSSFRVVVENAIGQIKRWKIVGGVFRLHCNPNEPLTATMIFSIVASFTNLKIKKTPLRSAEWFETKASELE